MHYFVEQVLHCFISLTKGEWDVLLPSAEFTPNMTYSDGTRYYPAFVLYSHELVLPFKYTICYLFYITIAFVADLV